MDWSERKTLIKIAYIAFAATIIAAIIGAAISITPQIVPKKDVAIQRAGYDSLSMYIGDIRKATTLYINFVMSEYDKKIKNGTDSFLTRKELITQGHAYVKTECHNVAARLEEGFPVRPMGKDWQEILSTPYKKYYSPFVKNVITAYEQGVLIQNMDSLAASVYPCLKQLDSIRLKLAEDL